MRDYTRLSMRERCNLTRFLEMGFTAIEIARRMNRHRSSLYREIERNATSGRYRPGLAHQIAQNRCPRRAMKIDTDMFLKRFVADKLRAGWSPEQIAGPLKLESSASQVCHETIYRYIYNHSEKNCISTCLTANLSAEKSTQGSPKNAVTDIGDLSLKDPYQSKKEAEKVTGRVT